MLPEASFSLGRCGWLYVLSVTYSSRGFSLSPFYVSSPVSDNKGTEVRKGGTYHDLMEFRYSYDCYPSKPLT